jgi:hypothetical protein
MLGAGEWARGGSGKAQVKQGERGSRCTGQREQDWTRERRNLVMGSREMGQERGREFLQE